MVGDNRNQGVKNNENSETYNAQEIESKWQEIWRDNETYVVSETTKAQVLLSGDVPVSVRAIHMGHVRNYTIGDVISGTSGQRIQRPAPYGLGRIWHAC